MSGPVGPLLTKAKLMAWVEDYAERMDLDAARTLFLTKFALWAGFAFESAVKVETLTRQCRCSERMLQKMRAEFVAQGVLVATGRDLNVEDSKRGIPLYRWTLFLDEFRASAMGAQGAPQGEIGVHGDAPMGAQGVHPQIELIEPTPSDEGDAHGARAAQFERLERAYPKRGLGFTNRARARLVFNRLVDEGLDPELLIAAAAAWAADPKGRNTDRSLEFWLADGNYRGFWPEGDKGLSGPVAPAAAGVIGHAAPDADQAIWAKAMADMRARLGDDTFGSYLMLATLGRGPDGRLIAVAATGVARDWINRQCWRRVTAAWSEAGGAAGLTLMSKHEFTALFTRQTADADMGVG